MKKTLIVTILLLFAGTLAFAQDVGISADLLLRFQWTRVKEGDDWTVGPDFEAAARIFLPGTSFIQTGLSGAVSFGFPRRMEFTFPERYDGTPIPGIKRPEPGESFVFTSSNSDLFSLSAFVGLAMKTREIGIFSIVSDFGVIFGWDSVSSEDSYLYGGSRRVYTDLSNNFLGLGVGVGLQLVLGSIILEGGVNLRISLMQWSTVYLYTAEPSNKNDKDALVDKSGNFEYNRVFRYGAPYISVGYKF